MAKKSGFYPLLIKIVKCSRLPWYWVTVIIAVILLMGLVLAAFLDVAFTRLSEWGFWRNFLDGPVLITYILVVYPFIWQLWWRAVDTLQSLLPADEVDSTRLEVGVPVPNRRWEWVATLIGAVFWLSLWQPWGWGNRWEAGAIWLSAYDVVTQSILFGLLSLLLYSSFTGNRYLNRLIRQRLNLDIFNTKLLTPIAHSSLGFSIAFIGGISLSMVFQTQNDLLMWNNIIVWVIMVCFVVLLFFLSMWSTHTAMAQAKNRELDLVQKHLKAASLELKEGVEESSLMGKEELSSELYSSITALVNYERRVKEVPEWPYNASIIRRLVASTFAPIVVFLIKVYSGLGIRFW
ncbi:MAG: hypothetical protein JSW16_09060 [Dehalococcoidales bacterium]|nr:MAG: hypothetical protein JSW16_09060 [Dehalococcoidales bacterium]